MKQRICYLLLTIICSYTAVAQKTRLYFDHKWLPSSAEQAAYLCDLEKNDSGWYRADYSVLTGQLLKHGFYKDADCTIKQGAFEYFFGNGEIKNTEKYVNNKKQGAYYAFYPNRMISDSFQFKNDIPYGLCSSWYPSGNPMTEMQMDTLGNGSGTVIGFFEDGTVSFKGKLAAGLRKTGNWFYYHPNGQRASVLQYGNQENNEAAAQPLVKYDDFEHIYYDSTVVHNNAICYDINGVQLPDCKIVNEWPAYPGGVQGWTNYLSGQLPDMIGKPNGPKKTTTYVAYFTIYPDGTKSDPILDNTVNKEFDNEIKALLKRSRKWKPALHNNRIIPFLNKQSLTLLRTF